MALQIKRTNDINKTFEEANLLQGQLAYNYASGELAIGPWTTSSMDSPHIIGGSKYINKINDISGDFYAFSGDITNIITNEISDNIEEIINNISGDIINVFSGDVVTNVFTNNIKEISNVFNENYEYFSETVINNISGNITEITELLSGNFITKKSDVKKGDLAIFTEDGDISGISGKDFVENIFHEYGDEIYNTYISGNVENTFEEYITNIFEDTNNEYYETIINQLSGNFVEKQSGNGGLAVFKEDGSISGYIKLDGNEIGKVQGVVDEEYISESATPNLDYVDLSGIARLPISGFDSRISELEEDNTTAALAISGLYKIAGKISGRLNNLEIISGFAKIEGPNSDIKEAKSADDSTDISSWFQADNISVKNNFNLSISGTNQQQINEEFDYIINGLIKNGTHRGLVTYAFGGNKLYQITDFTPGSLLLPSLSEGVYYFVLDEKYLDKQIIQAYYIVNNLGIGTLFGGVYAELNTFWQNLKLISSNGILLNLKLTGSDPDKDGLVFVDSAPIKTLTDIDNPQFGDTVIVVRDELHGNKSWKWMYIKRTSGEELWVPLRPDDLNSVYDVSGDYIDINNNIITINSNRLLKLDWFPEQRISGLITFETDPQLNSPGKTILGDSDVSFATEAQVSGAIASIIMPNVPVTDVQFNGTSVVIDKTAYISGLTSISGGIGPGLTPEKYNISGEINNSGVFIITKFDIDDGSW